MSIDAKAKLVLDQARALSREVESWADFSNGLFDQTTGLVATSFADPMERQTFYDSEHYAKLKEIFLTVIKKSGVSGGANPVKSGRILVRIPRTLHTVLEIEAKREGISLNQLAVAKLTIPLRRATKPEMATVAKAFGEVHNGYSTDRVVVDPDLNPKFLKRCREMGLTQSDYALNLLLFNVRKNVGRLGIRLSPTRKDTQFRDYDDYQFGAEIAARILERTEGATLDRALCDPELRQRFDQLALPLVLETSVLKIRCAALNLRKTCRLRPGEAQAPHYDLVSAGPVRAIDMSNLPAMQGTYVFYDKTRPIYAGETANLQKRVGIHLQPGRLPMWLDVRDPGFTLKYFIAPSAPQKDRLLWVRQFINAERPVLNYQEAAA